MKENNWTRLTKTLPDFDIYVLVWNENEPDEPPRDDRLESIETNSKGTLLKWYRNGQYTHWMPLPKPP